MVSVEELGTVGENKGEERRIRREKEEKILKMLGEKKEQKRAQPNENFNRMEKKR
jgi:hypothetical protein